MERWKLPYRQAVREVFLIKRYFLDFWKYIRPSLKAVGKTPVCREELSKVVIAGSDSPRQVFSNRVGIGSEGHDLGSDFSIILRMISDETWSKLAREQLI